VSRIPARLPQQHVSRAAPLLWPLVAFAIEEEEEEEDFFAK